MNSLTGYAPVLSPDGTTLLAVLGIDMVDSDVRAALARARTISAIVIGAALLLTVLASILMGTLFTRGIVLLDRVVRTPSAGGISPRAPLSAPATRSEAGEELQ